MLACELKTFQNCILSKFALIKICIHVQIDRETIVSLSRVLNPIPAGGEGQFDPPCSFFYITQKVLV